MGARSSTTSRLAKKMPWCRYCLADTHSSACMLRRNPKLVPSRRTAARSVLRARQAEPWRVSRAAVSITPLVPLPAHRCTNCKRPHPLAECGERRLQPPAGKPAGCQNGPGRDIDRAESGKLPFPCIVRKAVILVVHIRLCATHRTARNCFQALPAGGARIHDIHRALTCKEQVTW